MSTPKPILIAQEVFARLQQITRANGYHTDAGLNVTRGWGLHAIAGEGELPLLAVHPASNSITSRNAAKTKNTRTLEIEGIVDAEDSDAPADDLDLLYADVMRALALGDLRPLGGLAASVLEPSASFQIPEDGSRLAIVTISLPFTYIEG